MVSASDCIGSAHLGHRPAGSEFPREAAAPSSPAQAAMKYNNTPGRLLMAKPLRKECKKCSK